MKGFVWRSKKSGRYFRFMEYCEDGYGKYEDVVTGPGVAYLPTIHANDQLPIPEFVGHSERQIEVVPIHINVAEPDALNKALEQIEELKKEIEGIHQDAAGIDI